MRNLIPQGMTRRHFMKHLIGASAMTAPALALGHSVRTFADELQRNQKAAIMLWMGGGPSTIDLWDLKPGAPTGGPFKPISTSGDVQICEHLPQMAKQMHNAVHHSIDEHARGRPHAWPLLHAHGVRP